MEVAGLEQIVPYEMKDFHTDNGGEFLNWALHRHLNGRAVKTPWTRSVKEVLPTQLKFFVARFFPASQ
jgi:hypothetical protein